MISMEDCIAMCGLEMREIEAIAEHEHLSEIQAAALANDLLRSSGGERKIRLIMVDCITVAIRQRRLDRAGEVCAVLRHFVSRHPGAIS